MLVLRRHTSTRAQGPVYTFAKQRAALAQPWTPGRHPLRRCPFNKCAGQFLSYFLVRFCVQSPRLLYQAMCNFIGLPNSTLLLK